MQHPSDVYEICAQHCDPHWEIPLFIETIQPTQCTTAPPTGIKEPLHQSQTSPLIYSIALLLHLLLYAVLCPSAAMPWWRCCTRLYGSTPTSQCCPQPCWTSSAPPPRSSSACCPALCHSSLSYPWKRSVTGAPHTLSHTHRNVDK